VDSRAERIGKNEGLFREVNERIGEISQGTPAEFICECGDKDCRSPVRLSTAEYERVRAEPTRFLVRPGHEMPEVERVVERHEQFFVVEKDEGGPAALAVETDPRT
jgi:hypothetical protein